MATERSQTTFRPDLRAAVPAAIIKSAFGAAVMAGAVWFLVDAVDISLGWMVFGVLTFGFSILAVGNLQSRKYHFHGDYVEVHEGFLNVTQNNVPYNRVTDVGFTKSVWQRLFDVGTVHLNTAGSDQQEISISHVENPESVYEEIKSLIGG